MTSDLVIDEVLASLGFRSEEALRLARAALIDARLTNASKQRIAARKLGAIRELLGDRFIILCTRCRDAASDDRVVIAAERPADCAACGGSANDAAMRAAITALHERGLRKIAVVGGSPGTHDGLRTAVNDRLDLRIVPGTERRNAHDAKADLAWADLVVIWGGTELGHKVSKLYTDTRDPKVVTCGKRGVAALAATMTEAANRRTARHR